MAGFELIMLSKVLYYLALSIFSNFDILPILMKIIRRYRHNLFYTYVYTKFQSE